MFIYHVAFVCSSEAKCDLFYQNILGLKKIETKVLAPGLAKQIFNLDNSYQIINYKSDNMHFEIFLSEQINLEKKGLSHICLGVNNLEIFLMKCKSMGVEIMQIPKGESFVIFIKDFDGNLFEIKEKK